MALELTKTQWKMIKDYLFDKECGPARLIYTLEDGSKRIILEDKATMADRKDVEDEKGLPMFELTVVSLPSFIPYDIPCCQFFAYVVKAEANKPSEPPSELTPTRDTIDLFESFLSPLDNGTLTEEDKDRLRAKYCMTLRKALRKQANPTEGMKALLFNLEDDAREKANEALDAIAELQDGWNDNDAPAIPSDIIERARNVLKYLLYIPSVTPTAMPGIQMVYEDSDAGYIEFELLENDRVKMYFQDIYEYLVERDITDKEIPERVRQFIDYAKVDKSKVKR